MDGQMKLPADILYVILCSIPRREIHKYAAVNRQFYAMVKRRIDETNYLDDQQIRTFLGGCRLPPVAMDEILKSMTQITKARMAGEIRAVRYAMLELDGHWKLSMESDKKDRLQFSNYIRALGLDPDDYLIANGMLQPDLRIERVAGSTRWWIGAPGDEIGFDEGVWFDELFPDGTQLRVGRMLQSLAASNKEKMLVILRTTTDDGGTRHTIATESYRVVGGKLHVSSHAIKGVGRLSLLERCGRVLRRLCRCRRRGVQEAEVVSATRVYEKVAKTD